MYDKIEYPDPIVKYSQLCLSRIPWDWRNYFNLEKIRLLRGLKQYKKKKRGLK